MTHRFIATIYWAGSGAIPWTEYLYGSDATTAAECRRRELDEAHPDCAPHVVRCDIEE